MPTACPFLQITEIGVGTRILVCRLPVTSDDMVLGTGPYYGGQIGKLRLGLPPQIPHVEIGSPG